MKKKLYHIGLLCVLVITVCSCGSDDINQGRGYEDTTKSSLSVSKETVTHSLAPTEELISPTEAIAVITECPKKAEEKKIVTTPSATEVPNITVEPTQTYTEHRANVRVVSEPVQGEVVIPPTKEPIVVKPTEVINTVPPVKTEVPKSEVLAEGFDISYWISYAKQYALSIGLELDETAIYCWDNPIAANSKCTSLEENLVSRLNRYKNIEGFTAVWIWTEKISESELQKEM